MAAHPSGPEVAGVVVGAVLLFCLISLLPVFMAWRQRRRRTREAEETRGRQSCFAAGYPPASTQQISLEDWLQRQHAPVSVEQFLHEKCPICLSALAACPSQESLAVPQPVHCAKTENYHDAAAAAGLDDQQQGACRSLFRMLVTDGSQSATVDERIRILNPCNHVFHTSCLAAWTKYGNWACPMCKAPYVPCSLVV